MSYRSESFQVYTVKRSIYEIFDCQSSGKRFSSFVFITSTVNAKLIFVQNFQSMLKSLRWTLHLFVSYRFFSSPTPWSWLLGVSERCIFLQSSVFGFVAASRRRTWHVWLRSRQKKSKRPISPMCIYLLCCLCFSFLAFTDWFYAFVMSTLERKNVILCCSLLLSVQ